MGTTKRYCEICGATNVKRKPLTMDQLKAHDGKPVFYIDEWFIVWLDDDKNAWLQRPVTLGVPIGNDPELRESQTICLLVDESMEIYSMYHWATCTNADEFKTKNQ